jgi:hypothetical protein
MLVSCVIIVVVVLNEKKWCSVMIMTFVKIVQNKFGGLKNPPYLCFIKINKQWL